MDQAITQTLPTLAAREVSVVRGYRTLLGKLSFELVAGSILHIHGANGCGKTSLIYVLTGLRRAEAGEIVWSDKPIQDDLFTYRQQLCFVGHENAIKLELSVRENLHNFYQWQVCKPLVPGEVLGRLGLAAHADDLCHQLSAGQRRKLSLARLLLTQAPLWILDEPFTALDQASINFFQSLITQHAQAGGIVILTSHQALDWEAYPVTDLLLEQAAA